MRVPGFSGGAGEAIKVGTLGRSHKYRRVGTDEALISQELFRHFHGGWGPDFRFTISR